VMPSSETELARGGAQLSIETGPHARGVSSPQARRSPARGGRPTLERDGTSLEGATGPRARQSCTGAAPYPSSGVEFHPRVARPIVWWAVGLFCSCV
jgi:hypothetical protein